MATATVKYFHQTTELARIGGMSNEQFAIQFPGVKGLWRDSFTKLVGWPATGTSGPLPVQRVIRFKRFASRHECNAKCLGGRHNGACECQCGGVNHGLGSILSAGN